MSPPANIQRLHTPRTAATVLGEIREAHQDYEVAIADLSFSRSPGETDADDRAVEAEQRRDRLRDEFNARVQAALGLSVEDLRAAYSEAVL